MSTNLNPNIYNLIRMTVERDLRKKLEDEIALPMVADYEKLVRKHIRQWTKDITIERLTAEKELLTMAMNIHVLVDVKGIDDKPAGGVAV